MHKGAPMASKKKKKPEEFASPIDLQVHAVEQEPVVPVSDPVEEYLHRTYPRLDETQNIPNLLYAILREIVTWRLK